MLTLVNNTMNIKKLNRGDRVVSLLNKEIGRIITITGDDLAVVKVEITDRFITVPTYFLTKIKNNGSSK